MVQWLRMQVLGMEVPGSNSGRVFSDIFCIPFLSHGDCISIPQFYICLSFAS